MRKIILFSNSTNKILKIFEFVEKIDISSPSTLYRVHRCVTCFLLSTELKTTVSIFSPENGSGSNYIETSPSFKLFGKINSFHILWSSIFVAFSTKSTVTPINNFLLRFLFFNYFTEVGSEIRFRFTVLVKLLGPPWA